MSYNRADSSTRIALVAEHHPASAQTFGTSGLIKTLCAAPCHPFQAVVATDLAGSTPIAGPWQALPVLSLFRPRSLLPKIGLGLLDNFFFAMQRGRITRFLRRHQINRLFILLANNPRLALFAAADLPAHLPKDIYLVDDFVEDSHLYRVKKVKARQAMEKLLRESDRVFVISPVSGEDLSRDYGRSGEFLPIPISDAKLTMVNQGRKLKSPDTGTLLIHHSGTIHHLYAEAMANFILLLNRLAAKRQLKITLEFWGNVTMAGLERTLNMRLHQQNNGVEIKFCGNVTSERLIIEQQRADFLLLVNSFAPDLKKQLRYSFSSKTTEYLISGTPILLYAPAYSSLTVHLGQHQAAHIISTEAPEAALPQLERIIDYPNRAETVAAAQKLAKEYHAEEHFFNVIKHGSAALDIP